jgi:hypothetical protein
MFFDDIEAQKHSNGIPHKKELNNTKFGFFAPRIWSFDRSLSLLHHFSLIFSLSL